MDAQKTKEERIQLAMQALKNMDVPNISQAAKIFDIPRRTLGGRIQGVPSSDARQQAQQRLSVQEEESIARAICTLTRWGWPMSIQWLESFATNLLQKKGDYDDLGHNWYIRFLE
jgi:hypothetical protein